MKILLIGKTGQLGGDILKNNYTRHKIYAPDRSILDLESRSSISAVIKDIRPHWVINTAAFHNVPLCEDEREKAFRMNCMAVQDLAIICREEGSRLINFSSDYVFGGEKNTPYCEEDTPRPIQMYGISRLAGEYAALAVAPQHNVIIRTCGLYGTSGAQSKGGNFVDKRIHEARNHTSMEMGCDQIVSPTYTDDLGQALLDLIDHQQFKPGIYHLVNEGECSWYEFTIAIFEFMGINIEVKPVDRGGMSGEMRRPIYSALANTKARALGIVLPHWRDGLERYLKEKYNS